MTQTRPCPYCDRPVRFQRVVKSSCFPVEVEVPEPHDAPCGLPCGEGFRQRGAEHHPGNPDGCPRCGGGRPAPIVR
jgi:hypothetical protein